MTEQRQNLYVGIFAVAGVAVFGILILMFGQVLNLTLDMYDLRIIFPQGATTTLREGSAVTLHGKRIGQTTAIDFRDPARPGAGIEVVVAIEGRYALPRSARAEVQTSLMGFGRPALQIVVDEALPEEPMLPRDGTAEITGRVVPMLDQVIKPQVQSTLETATRQIGELAAALKPVADDLHHILEVRPIDQVDADAAQRFTANLYTAIQRLDQTLKSFNDVIGSADNQENFARSLENIRVSTEKFAAAMDDFQAFAREARGFAGEARETTGRINQTLDSFRVTVDTSGRKFADVADAASGALRELNRTVLTLNSGQGTAGLLLTDNRLYESLVLSADRIVKAFDELRDLVALMKKGDVRLRVF